MSFDDEPCQQEHEVYFALETKTGGWKIGAATNPSNRLRWHERNHPGLQMNLQWTLMCSDANCGFSPPDILTCETEKAFQKKFEAYRLPTDRFKEWFSSEAPIPTLISELRRQSDDYLIAEKRRSLLAGTETCVYCKTWDAWNHKSYPVSFATKVEHDARGCSPVCDDCALRRGKMKHLRKRQFQAHSPMCPDPVLPWTHITSLR